MNATPVELAEDTEKLLAALYLIAMRKGVTRSQVDQMVFSAMYSVHERFEKLRNHVFPVIACADSAILEADMLKEASLLFLFRTEDVFSDYKTWQRNGGRPAA